MLLFNFFFFEKTNIFFNNLLMTNMLLKKMKLPNTKASNFLTERKNDNFTLAFHIDILYYYNEKLIINHSLFFIHVRKFAQASDIF